jgi:hypothetical protein
MTAADDKLNRNATGQRLRGRNGGGAELSRCVPDRPGLGPASCLASYAHAARRLVLASAGELDELLAAWRDGTLTDEAVVAAELNVFRAQQIVLPLVLAETTQLFEVGAASAVGRQRTLDRHWRNVRTTASHNPAIQRKRAIGDYALNGRAPKWGRPRETEDGAGESSAG